MKAKGVVRQVAVKSVQAIVPKGSAVDGDSTARAHPFLVHALRLRPRKLARRRASTSPAAPSA